MTLMTGLRHDERLAGLVGLSGYLPLAAKAEAERHAANRDVPIFLAHGTHRSGDPDRARAPVARRAGRARPPGRVARVPDAAFGLRRGDRRPRSAGCCACWAASRSARERGAAALSAPSTDEPAAAGRPGSRRRRSPPARRRASASRPGWRRPRGPPRPSRRRPRSDDEQGVVDERTKLELAHDASPSDVGGGLASDCRPL